MRPKLLIVVDNDANFAVHVWRYLTGPMEFGFSSTPLETFVRTSPDGSLTLRWFNPEYEVERELEPGEIAEPGEKEVAKRRALRAFRWWCEAAKHCEVWCILDVRGLRGRDRTRPAWDDYRTAFTSLRCGDLSRVWVISSYGDRQWRTEPGIRAKTVDTLDSFARRMELPFGKPVGGTARVHGEFNVLVTGAGFELWNAHNTCGESTGFPTTAALLHAMRIVSKLLPSSPDARASAKFPLGHLADDIARAVANDDLDAWWDAMLAFLQRNKPEGFDELGLREAFRRSFLEHDFGHQRQSLIAAELGWDYWLTTNYSRFSDRAIDMVGNAGDSPRSWRAITTSIEADAVAPELDGPVKDLAQKNRVLIKLHGDIGHVWTMAIAGQDKLPSSNLHVRPQLFRMYTAAESMLLASLWERTPRPELCRWYVVGHGLRDKSLVRLIANVIQRSPHSMKHLLVHVRPREKILEAKIKSINATKSRFTEALKQKPADELFDALTNTNQPRLEFDSCPASALEFMSTLGTVHHANAEFPPEPNPSRESYMRELRGSPDPTNVDEQTKKRKKSIA